jgi:hypothetical protein
MATRKQASKRPSLSEEQKAERKAALAAETKRERFVRLAAPRMTRLLKDIKLLSNCAKGKTEYTQGDVDRMKTAIGDALQECFNLYEGKKQGGSTGFSF